MNNQHTEVFHRYKLNPILTAENWPSPTINSIFHTFEVIRLCQTQFLQFKNEYISEVLLGLYFLFRFLLLIKN